MRELACTSLPRQCQVDGGGVDSGSTSLSGLTSRGTLQELTLCTVTHLCILLDVSFVHPSVSYSDVFLFDSRSSKLYPFAMRMI